MNQSLGSQSLHPSGILPNGNQSLDAILNFLKLVQADNNQALALSKAFEIMEFQIGDELANYTNAALGENTVHSEQNAAYYQIICQGRVRLLGFDFKQKRETSTLVLQAGEAFGIENVFANQPRLTRAIAASAGVVARLPITQLKQWLEKLPNLGEFLSQQAQQRQCLIFFKTSTELRSLSSHQLLHLLPYFG